MQITHEEARRLVHVDLDQGLNPQQRMTLQSHLARCADCSHYATGLHKLESILHPLLKRQWEQHPLPLSTQTLLPGANSKVSNSLFLATRIAAFGLMFMAFVFSAWQLTQSRTGISGPSSASAAPAPLASTLTQPVNTTRRPEKCAETVYLVKANDDLVTIATQFALSQAEILNANHLEPEMVHSGMKLIIPACSSTPTGTVNALTTTFTPSLLPITSTPGG